MSNFSVIIVSAGSMMTSSNGNIFRVTGPFWGDRWIPLTKASDAELCCFLFIYAWTNGWANNRNAADLRRHRAHYDITVMGHIVLYQMGLVNPHWSQKCVGTDQATNHYWNRGWTLSITSPSVIRRTSLNSLRPSDAYMRQQTNHHWLRWWFGSDQTNQCWNVVNSNLGNKFQRNLKRNS